MAVKPQSSNRRTSLVPVHSDPGFWIKLQLPPGMSTRMQTKRLRKLEDAIEDAFADEDVREFEGRNRSMALEIALGVEDF